MTDAPSRCEPPEEWRRKSAWHWLCHPDGHPLMGFWPAGAQAWALVVSPYMGANLCSGYIAPVLTPGEIAEREATARAKGFVEASDVIAWEDRKIPEDDEMLAAHPLKTGRHDLYLEAMRLVHDKRGKGPLVLLVNWLLARETAAYQRGQRDMRQAAATRAAAEFPQAHTYASENADIYRAQNDAQERIAAAIAALPIKEKPE